MYKIHLKILYSYILNWNKTQHLKLSSTKKSYSSLLTLPLEKNALGAVQENW